MITLDDARRITEKNKLDSVKTELIRIEQAIKDAIGKKHTEATISFDYDVHPSLIEEVKKTGLFNEYWKSEGYGSSYYLTLKWPA